MSTGNVDHDWVAAEGSQEWDECKRCNAKRHIYEYNVPCSSVMRYSYWLGMERLMYEPRCCERA
jgi:hypothetical protein